MSKHGCSDQLSTGTCLGILPSLIDCSSIFSRLSQRECNNRTSLSDSNNLNKLPSIASSMAADTSPIDFPKPSDEASWAPTGAIEVAQEDAQPDAVPQTVSPPILPQQTYPADSQTETDVSSKAGAGSVSAQDAEACGRVDDARVQAWGGGLAGVGGGGRDNALSPALNSARRVYAGHGTQQGGEETTEGEEAGVGGAEEGVGVEQGQQGHNEGMLEGGAEEGVGRIYMSGSGGSRERSFDSASEVLGDDSGPSWSALVGV